MANDTSTLNGSLQQLGETMATNLTTKGVTASASDGLTTLAGKILNIPSGSGSSGPTNILQGSFTTANSGNTTGSLSLNYTGTGYPIMVMIVVHGGMYNDTSNGDTTWYNSKNRYDVGFVAMTKARMTSTPTYTTSGADNYGVVDLIYKNSTSTATSYTSTRSATVNMYTSSSTNAQASTACIRFKGNGKTLSYYIGNRASGSIGLARNTTFDYIVVYSS